MLLATSCARAVVALVLRGLGTAKGELCPVAPLVCSEATQVGRVRQCRKKMRQARSRGRASPHGCAPPVRRGTCRNATRGAGNARVWYRGEAVKVRRGGGRSGGASSPEWPDGARQGHVGASWRARRGRGARGGSEGRRWRGRRWWRWWRRGCGVWIVDCVLQAGPERRSLGHEPLSQKAGGSAERGKWCSRRCARHRWQ